MSFRLLSQSRKRIEVILSKFALAVVAIAVTASLGIYSSSAHSPTPISNSFRVDQSINSSVSYNPSPENPIDSSSDLYASGNCSFLDCTNLRVSHIRDRHCTGTCIPGDRSDFVSAYCGSEANMRKFCNAIKNSSNCHKEVGSLGRLLAIATLSSNVGEDSRNSCNMTNTGTVVYQPSSNLVISQHPGEPIP